MSKPTRYTPETKHLLIPPSMRVFVAHGERPYYRLTKPDYDRVPVGTFLVLCEPGTMGLVPLRFGRIVKPNDPSKYPVSKLTPGKRLIYISWRGGSCVKSLEDAKMATWRYVVMPGEQGYHILDAFKIACDTRRAGGHRSIKPTLLLRGLGIEDEYNAFVRAAPNVQAT